MEDNMNICAACSCYFEESERFWADSCNHCHKTFCGSHLIQGECWYDDKDAVCELCASVTCPEHRIIYTEEYCGQIRTRGNHYVEGGDHQKCVECLAKRRALETCVRHRLPYDPCADENVYYLEGGDHSKCEVCLQEKEKKEKEGCGGPRSPT